MNKQEIKTKWIAELRSGNHKQIKGTLKGQTEDNTGAGFCCLGVLEEKVLGNNLVTTEVLVSDYDGDLYYNTEGPQEIYDKFRRSDFLGDSLVTRLTSMNDEEGYTFAEIADYIEAKWEITED